MIPKNKEHLNTWFIRGVIKDYTSRGFTVEQKMEDDGLHVVITGPFKNKKLKRLEFYDI